MSNLTYCIFSANEINLIDFSEVMETSTQTLRYSLDGTLTFVKWDTLIVPQCVQQLTTKQPYYDHNTMLEIMVTDAWYDPDLGPK